jgi:hypothetical protein
MKNFLKTIFFAFLVIAIGSCEEDIDPKVSANGFALRAPSAVSPLVLSPQNDNNEVVALEWDKSNNGVGASVSTYKIEVAESGTDFANAVTANAGNDVTTADRTYVLKVGELNTLVNQLPGYQCGVPMDVDIRVKSTLGGTFYNSFVQYSTNVITVNVTPYSSALPTLAFSSTGVIDDSTPRLAASGVLNTDYEGYMWLTPGLYKFYMPNACGGFDAPTVYGDDGSGAFSTLAINGSGYQVITAGFFLVRANTATSGVGALSYSVRPTTWNLFGAAKPTFPQANSAMTYDQTTKLWKITITLSQGYEFKFRSNGTGSAALILGKYNAASIGTSAYGGPILTYAPSASGSDLNVPGSKTNPRTNVSYDVTLDLNSPRNYNYTITEH